MTSFLYEVQRTVSTMALLPWQIVRHRSSGSSPPQPLMGGNVENESLRWVVIQIAVLYVFYRLMTPLFSLKKNRSYSKARTLMDAWLLSALAIHTPALSVHHNPRPMKLFASVFALFLVSSHLMLAIFTLTWHLLGWITRTFWPSLVDVLWLPSGQKWKAPSMGNLIRFSLVLSLSTSLVFVGCTIDAQQTSNPDDLPLICQGGWYTHTKLDEDGATFYHNLGYLGYLSHLSFLNSPVGLLWLSGLALFVIYYTTRRSSRLSLRARMKAAMGLEDVWSRADALFQTEVEEGYTTDPTAALRSSGKQAEAPDFLDMCEWYSVAMVETAVQLLISLKLFFGRFDVRMLKRPTFGSFAQVITSGAATGGDTFRQLSMASLASAGSPFLTRRRENQYESTESLFHIGEGVEEADFYFDWMADTGDGGNSTYQVARWLAKPVLHVRKDAACIQMLKNDPSAVASGYGDLALPRGRILLIGGDLAYPDPSIENLDKRLFRPFCDAMEPPPSFRYEQVSSLRREDDEDQRRERETILANNNHAPVCFCLAGNHDHFDGLHAFYRCIVDRDWLGGWRLPQSSSYFAIRLIHGWWLFAFDQALGEDIDATQFRYFEHLASNVIGPDEQIIVTSHEPIWLYDAYCEAPKKDDVYATRAPLVKELLFHRLKDKVALRLCGDLHNYMRYQTDEKSGLNLVISGGGGAFLHPTHCFPDELSENGTDYKLKSCYPDVAASRRLGLENLGSGFRVHNWRFDFVGASMYFLMCVSLFPRCGIKARVIDASTGGLPSYLENYVSEICSMIMDAFREGYISPITMIVAVLITIGFADGEKGIPFQLRLGLAHGLMHVLVALTACLVFQITVETAIADNLAGASFYSLFDSYLETERGAVPPGARTDDYFLQFIREILRFFDMPEAVAVPHRHWCSSGMNVLAVEPQPLTRFDTVFFYIASFSYLYVISADLVALVIGVYLAVSSSVLSVHWNEAFSSLRHPHLKNFIRFKINKTTGDLHAFVLGIDRVPQSWMRNVNYETTAERMKRLKISNEMDRRVASFGASTPSKWVPVKRRDVLQSKPRLVDYFVVKKKVPPLGTSSNRGSVSSNLGRHFGSTVSLASPKGMVTAPKVTKLGLDENGVHLVRTSLAERKSQEKTDHSE